MKKLKIGIIFGGNSREREVSFAGGRTVYDNLDKSLFDAVPLFADSFGNLLLIEWQYIYKGSIRDFYPVAQQLPESKYGFQVYAESLKPKNNQEKLQLMEGLGKPVAWQDLPQLIDFAFLALHGANGEDGRMQGMLELAGIPYSGSGILPSALGMNKRIQRQWMQDAGLNVPRWTSIRRAEWKTANASEFFQKVKETVGFPCVVKPANQGSSLGVSILETPDLDKFIEAVHLAFFKKTIAATEWVTLTKRQKFLTVAALTDFRDGLGLPVFYEEKLLFHPDEVYDLLEHELSTKPKVELQALDAESEVLVEQFLEGKEFSCIVIHNEEGKAIALPPTEIRKGKELFDYRSKYLPGLSRKITPINLEAEKIETIREKCVELFNQFQFNVYARIDGFVTLAGDVFLNDPNTTSGMMPSSFFFHQAAEIGLNPSSFLTYIIRTSLQERIKNTGIPWQAMHLLELLDKQMAEKTTHASDKINVAVILGGFSSERHISVESGRNIYEKLSSSEKYLPIPVFLTGTEEKHELYRIPINIMLKDNADDILDKIKNETRKPILEKIIEECKDLTIKYAGKPFDSKVERWDYSELPNKVSAVFIALHGRPGEDGEVQKNLEKFGIAYNGSGIASSQLTINKFETNNLLRSKGILVASSYLMQKKAWKQNVTKEIENAIASTGLPLIAKPADDGCSTGVKKIDTPEQLKDYASLVFREKEEIDPTTAVRIGLLPNEELPARDYFLIESLISPDGAATFLETTTGLLTHLKENGQIEYEIFEPSESLAEGGILSLEEKFLAGEGQNITPSRFSKNPSEQKLISEKVKQEIKRTAQILNIEGYARIDAFVRIFNPNHVETIIIEANSLPGMTPATCIFHQCALNGYKPYDFIDKILEYGQKRATSNIPKL